MKEKKTLEDAVLNIVHSNANFKTIFVDADEFVRMADSLFLSRAGTRDELDAVYNAVAVKMFKPWEVATKDGKYRLRSHLNPNSLLKRYHVSIYDGQTEYRYKAFSSGKIKKMIKARIDAVSLNGNTTDRGAAGNGAAAENGETAMGSSEPETIFCPRCGKKIKSSDKFCIHCGAPTQKV